MSEYLSDAEAHPEAERSAVDGTCGRIPATIEPPPYPDSLPKEIGTKTCPICGKQLTGQQRTACSDVHRAALSRRWRAEGQAEKDRRVRELVKVLAKEAGLTAEDFA